MLKRRCGRMSFISPSRSFASASGRLLGWERRGRSCSGRQAGTHHVGAVALEGDRPGGAAKPEGQQSTLHTVITEPLADLNGCA